MYCYIKRVFYFNNNGVGFASEEASSKLINSIYADSINKRIILYFMDGQTWEIYVKIHFDTALVK